MLRNYRRKEPGLVINLIKRRVGNSPNFALLVGAGASVSSGVRPACEMIREWRNQLYTQSKSSKKLDDWLTEQDWYNDDEEYSILFDKIYDQPPQRRNYIEECIKDATPSWGYIYLSSIVSQGFFNVIFTSNFDDLLNEACFTYANCKPVVCAHDSAASAIRVTSARPKIIKLHGDYLYDNIKNTVRETESLEKNMRDKFVQFATEYGLIVVGYRGNDRSIMDIIDTLVRTEGYFPHGVYWCIRKGSQPCRKLDRLLSREKVFLVEIDDFDVFMAELHEGLGLTLPDSVKDPYKATTERLNRFVLSTKMDCEIMRKDTAELQAQIKKYELLVKTTIPPSETPVPYKFLGKAAYDNGKLNEAIEYYEKAAIQDPALNILYTLAKLYKYANRIEKAVEMGEKIKTQNKFFGFRAIAFAYSQTNLELVLANLDDAIRFAPAETMKQDALVSKANELLVHNKNVEALSVLDEALKVADEPTAMLNKCIALKRLGRPEEAKQLVEAVLPKVEDGHPYTKACVYAFLNDKDKVLENLKEAIRNDRLWTVFALRRDPDFENYRDDSDFKRLLDEAIQPTAE